MARQQHRAELSAQVRQDPNEAQIVFGRICDAINTLSSKLNLLAAYAAASILFLSTLYILVEIVLRQLHRSTYMLDAFVGEGMAAIIMLAAPRALEQGAMVRVGFFLKTSRPQVRVMLELFAVLAAIVLFWLIFQTHFSATWRDFLRGRMSSYFVPTPVWVTGAIFLVGVGLTILQLFTQLLAIFRFGASKDAAPMIDMAAQE